jgi:hypothetical protein
LDGEDLVFPVLGPRCLSLSFLKESDEDQVRNLYYKREREKRGRRLIMSNEIGRLSGLAG